MMVGVDALITSWCKIFKPESHLVASSLESAVEVRGQKCSVTPWEDRPLLRDPPTHLPSPTQTTGLGGACAGS